MPGRAQNVGANDRTIVDLFFDLRVGKAFGALGDAPLGRRVVLGLNRAESGDDLGRGF